MSVTEIIERLSNLSQGEMRALRARLLELTAQNEEVKLCNETALEGALMLDRLEATSLERVLDE